MAAPLRLPRSSVRTCGKVTEAAVCRLLWGWRHDGVLLCHSSACSGRQSQALFLVVPLRVDQPVECCEYARWEQREQRRDRSDLRRTAHAGTRAKLDGWLSPCATRPTTSSARYWPSISSGPIDPSRCRPTGFWTHTITEGQHNDCDYIHRFEISIEPSGLVGWLSSSATQ